MLFTERLNKLGELGIKPGYVTWEKYLTRKLNYYSLISIATVLLAIVMYLAIGNYHFMPILVIAAFVFPMGMLFNAQVNYVYALYLFYLTASGVVFVLSYEMGENSMIYLFFFPLTISLITLLNKPEMNKHIRILGSVIMVLIFFNVVNIRLGWFHNVLNTEELDTVRLVNIFLSSFITLLFALALSRQNSIQENELLGLLKEKEILLAEVHHRVKNNMAIVTSLLNLKKETCTSDEAKEVLEDSKNRIYSMALIHKNIYGNRPIKNIDFRAYITELAEELVSVYTATNGDVKLSVDAVDCHLHIDTAIPCGFIINELITNSLKHARVKGRDLVITIAMKKDGNNIHLTYADNGPGFFEDIARAKNSLGMTLIELLNQQLNARYFFKNNPGMVYDMKFALPKNET
jgi:two-component sensor histidine kinase